MHRNVCIVEYIQYISSTIMDSEAPVLTHSYIICDIPIISLPFQLSQLYSSTRTRPTPACGSPLAAQVSRWESSSPTYRTTQSASPATTLSWALKPSPPEDITGRWRSAPRQPGAWVWCWPPSTGRRRSACVQRMVSGLWC